jgi:hypothetical protein
VANNTPSASVATCDVTQCNRVWVVWCLRRDEWKCLQAADGAENLRKRRREGKLTCIVANNDPSARMHVCFDSAHGSERALVAQLQCERWVWGELLTVEVFWEDGLESLKLIGLRLGGHGARTHTRARFPLFARSLKRFSLLAPCSSSFQPHSNVS